MCQDAWKSICFKLSMMLNTTTLYSMISVWMTLIFIHGHRVTGKLELVQSFCCKVKWAELSFCMGTGQPCPPQSPAALQVSSGEPKARVLTWHLSMGAWISSMKSPSGMHDPRGSESTCPGPSRFSTVVNSLERDGLRQAFLP